MKNEKVHRRRALFVLEAIEVCATSCRKDWKGRTPPTIEEVDAAWRIWQERNVIAKENLLQAEALLPNLIELFKGFTYKEMDQALHYVMKHHLKPVRVMKEEGLIE